MPASHVQSFAPCARCSQEKPIYEPSSGLCRACYGIRSNNLRMSKAKQVKVPCSVCGNVRSSHLLGRAICQACWLEEQNGRDLCKGCGKVKVIYVRSQSLCKHCYEDHLAPERLRRYVQTFATTYPYNQILFDSLAATIRWDTVHIRTLEQFRVFGRFLQAHALSNPLTWDCIEEILARLGSPKRPTVLHLRTCLFDLGHLLSAQRIIESYETYSARRRALLPIKDAPAPMQPLLQRFAADLWKRGESPWNVRQCMDVLQTFWVWCQGQGITSPEMVSTPLIKAYLLALHWHWVCSFCHEQMPFETDERTPPPACLHCGTLRSLSKKRRYSQNTVRQYRSKLRTFFAWAKSQRLVTANPVQGSPIQPTQRIQQYSPDVIRKLCDYVASPDADPVEAFVLYLILFHAFSTWELRHAQLPDLPLVNGAVQQMPLADAYYVRIPRPPPSRGRRTPGRIRLRQHFPEAAASWLKPLLARFEQARQPLLEHSQNTYLLLAHKRAHHCAPVSEWVVTEIVRRASLKVLGSVCSPHILRKTVATLFADQSGPGILHFLGWGQQQAYAYAWVSREIVQPHAVVLPQMSEPLPASESFVFPALDKPEPLSRPSSPSLSEEDHAHGPLTRNH